MSKILDGIIGFTVGDSIGVPVEFKSREELEEFSKRLSDKLNNGLEKQKSKEEKAKETIAKAMAIPNPKIIIKYLQQKIQLIQLDFLF